ncbi:MAG: hypothetical protein ACFE95_03805 [Candidatus Hodarchaeota archaeon]
MVTTLFDFVVLDTNFFISLMNAGVSDTLLPNLQKITQSVGMEVISPEEIPKSDIPSRFRELRRTIPKYIRLERVNRGSNLWNQTARYAVQERMVRVKDDPADIDVVILAKKFTLKNNNKVALVSDDEGVGRIIKENQVFKNIEHLSCGAFVSILAASVSDQEMRKILDQTVERVFRASWSYKKKTRRYIDVAMLIQDLTDTARFVRTAAQVGTDDSLKAIEKDKEAVIPSKEPEVLTPEDSLIIAQQLVIKARETREKYNIQEAERVLIEILSHSSNLIYTIDGLEQRVIIERMLRSELFEHHSWLLDYKLTRNHIVEALVHAEACRVYMNFISVGKEAIENLISLQGLLYLLLGQYDQALNLFKAIPTMDPGTTPTQLLGLCVALIATKQANEAVLIIKRSPDLFDGILASMHTYANDLYTHDQRTLAIEILKFIVKNFGDREEVYRSIYRLFILTRLRPDLIDVELKILKLFKTKLRDKAKDNSKRGIPQVLQRMVPIEISATRDEKEVKQFKGFYHILDLNENHEKDELNVIAWNESNHSTWNLIFDLAYKPALEESVKFRVTSGTITKINSPKKKDIFRGTLVFENPAIQPELVKQW